MQWNNSPFYKSTNGQKGRRGEIQQHFSDPTITVAFHGLCFFLIYSRGPRPGGPRQAERDGSRAAEVDHGDEAIRPVHGVGNRDEAPRTKS